MPIEPYDRKGSSSRSKRCGPSSAASALGAHVSMGRQMTMSLWIAYMQLLYQVLPPSGWMLLKYVVVVCISCFSSMFIGVGTEIRINENQ